MILYASWYSFMKVYLPLQQVTRRCHIALYCINESNSTSSDNKPAYRKCLDKQCNSSYHIACLITHHHVNVSFSTVLWVRVEELKFELSLRKSISRIAIFCGWKRRNQIYQLSAGSWFLRYVKWEYWGGKNEKIETKPKQKVKKLYGWGELEVKQWTLVNFLTLL